jgi:DNA invertase Pin-like site-specific DNA recombinase
MARIGYARVSIIDRDLGLQIAELRKPYCISLRHFVQLP